MRTHPQPSSRAHPGSPPTAPTAGADRDSEPTYFSDPAIDRLMGVVMSLASEVSILNDRLSAMERVLTDKGVVSAADRAAWEADPGAQAALDAEREAFVRGLMDPLLGMPVSRGVPRG